MKTLARNLCHRPKSPSTNTRSTYGDNYRAPYTFIRGVHLAQRIPGAREREIKRRGVSRSPFFFPKRGISLSGWGGPSIRQHERDYHTRPHNRRTHNRPRTTFPVSCYSCPSVQRGSLSTRRRSIRRQFACNPTDLCESLMEHGARVLLLSSSPKNGKRFPGRPVSPSFDNLRNLRRIVFA